MFRLEVCIATSCSLSKTATRPSYWFPSQYDTDVPRIPPPMITTSQGSIPIYSSLWKIRVAISKLWTEGLAISDTLSTFGLSDLGTDVRMTLERLIRCLFVSTIQLPLFPEECLLYGTSPFLRSFSLRGRRSCFAHVLWANSSALVTADPFLA